MLGEASTAAASRTLSLHTARTPSMPQARKKPIKPSKKAATVAGKRELPQRPLGAHQSIAGGFCRAVERAVDTGCECLQVFTRNINRWDTKPIDPAEAEAFRAAVVEAGLAPVVAHNSYLINPASADPDLRDRQQIRTQDVKICTFKLLVHAF